MHDVKPEALGYRAPVKARAGGAEIDAVRRPSFDSRTTVRPPADPDEGRHPACRTLGR
jgi:hypothetical protein